MLNAAKLLESLGHKVEEAAPAIDGKAVSAGYMTMYFGHVAAAVKRVMKLTGAAETAFDTDTRALALLGRALSAEAFVTAAAAGMRLRARWGCSTKPTIST